MKLWSLLFLSVFLTAGACDLDEEEYESEVEPAANFTSTQKVPEDYVRIEDPVEGAFSIEMPKGWHNRAYVSRAWDIYREVSTSVSPNGETVIFIGDPSAMQYWKPAYMNAGMEFAVRANPYIEVGNYISAQNYFGGYVRKKFGKLDEFKILSISPNEEVSADNDRKIAEGGMQATQTTVDVKFTYQDKGKPMSALVIGTTVDMQGFWLVHAAGISSEGNCEEFRSILMTMAESKKTNPEWKARQQVLHEQRMAELRARHANNMAWIQQSAARHQDRMKAIWAAGDASTKSYYERSASSDLQHRRFLNSINEESTVVGSGGRAVQVDNSYQRYFVNKNDNSYVGGDIRFDDNAIRKMGLNPDDYEEMKVRP